MRTFVLIFDPDGDLPGSHTSYKILNCHPKNAITGQSGSIVASCDSISLTQYNSLLFSLFSSALSFYPVIYIIECHSLFFEFEHWLFEKKCQFPFMSKMLVNRQFSCINGLLQRHCLS